MNKPRIIATEEAFATEEYIDAYLGIATKSAHAGTRYAAAFIGKPENRRRLSDIDLRLAEMDANGIDMHLLSLTSPGVQVFDADYATSLAIRCNDALAAWISAYPDRFAGLAAVAPQDPIAAAAEIDRAIGSLGLNGIIINSHTDGEFLDEPKFRPILAAAAKHRAPIYIHPTLPPPKMAEPLEPYGMLGAVWGFAAECGMHAMRMVLGGVFDEFPDLQIVLGHMGEGLPYWLYRMDATTANATFSAKETGVARIKKRPSEYVRSNIHITTSGIFWDDALAFVIKAMGIERVQFAIDYPYADTKEAADWIRAAPLNDSDKALILSGNAERVFGIKSR